MYRASSLSQDDERLKQAFSKLPKLSMATMMSSPKGHLLDRVEEASPLKVLYTQQLLITLFEKIHRPWVSPAFSSKRPMFDPAIRSFQQVTSRKSPSLKVMLERSLQKRFIRPSTGKSHLFFHSDRPLMSLRQWVDQRCYQSQYEMEDSPDFLNQLASLGHSSLSLGPSAGKHSESMGFCRTFPLLTDLLKEAEGLGINRVQYDKNSHYLRTVPAAFEGYLKKSMRGPCLSIGEIPP